MGIKSKRDLYSDGLRLGDKGLFDLKRGLGDQNFDY